jgi:hypothetical protein
MSWLVGTFTTPSRLCNIPHITCATTTVNVSHYCDSLSHVYCYEYAYHELATCVSRSASYVSCPLPVKMRATRSAETSVNENCALLSYCDYPEQHISEILRGGRLNSRTQMKWPVYKCIPNYLPVPPRINIFWLPLVYIFHEEKYKMRQGCFCAVSMFWAAANYGLRWCWNIFSCVKFVSIVIPNGLIRRIQEGRLSCSNGSKAYKK